MVMGSGKGKRRERSKKIAWRWGSKDKQDIIPKGTAPVTASFNHDPLPITRPFSCCAS